MILTPTYYVFKMYVPFQNAIFVPVAFDAGSYTHGSVTLPRVDAIAAKSVDGKLLIEITNLDAENPVAIEADLAGTEATSAKAETLTGAAVDSINTFDSPDTVTPKSTAVKVVNGKLSLTVASRSVTVISIEP
jgi:alpha-L-arabinofuranosidase